MSVNRKRRKAMKHGLGMTCMHPRCSEEAVVHLPGLEGREFMCAQHTSEQVNQPHNIARTNAQMEADDFLEEGGKLN
jgi:hypothetical protein